MDDALSAPLFAGTLLVGMLVMLEVGRRIGRRQLARDPELAKGDAGAIAGAIFALFAFLLAFTFSGAASRLYERRQLVAEEANAIGTAWLRLDLLPAADQPALRDEFRVYLASRLAAYAKLPDLTAAMAELAHSTELQHEIWVHAVAATRLEGGHPEAGKLLLPAINEMIDITTTRTTAAQIHPPKMIYALLFAMGLGCSLLAGHGLAARPERPWLLLVGYALLTAITVFVIVEIEYPRLGFFRSGANDQVLVDLLDSMK